MSELQVLDLLQRWADVELRGEADGYGDLLTSDFLGNGPVGFVLTADQWANRHRGDLNNDEFQVQDPHVRIYRGDTAVVEAVLRQKTTAMGRDTSGSFRLVVGIRFDLVDSECTYKGEPLPAASGSARSGSPTTSSGSSLQCSTPPWHKAWAPCATSAHNKHRDEPQGSTHGSRGHP